ncbi:MAG: hypothetical protein IPO40_21125 [Fibrobacteres bacterium]|nr:hypothetical protein [Fibrobacterota bacterium]
MRMMPASRIFQALSFFLVVLAGKCLPAETLPADPRLSRAIEWRDQPERLRKSLWLEGREVWSRQEEVFGSRKELDGRVQTLRKLFDSLHSRELRTEVPDTILADDGALVSIRTIRWRSNTLKAEIVASLPFGSLAQAWPGAKQVIDSALRAKDRPWLRGVLSRRTAHDGRMRGGILVVRSWNGADPDTLLRALGRCVEVGNCPLGPRDRLARDSVVLRGEFLDGFWDSHWWVPNLRLVTGEGPTQALPRTAAVRFLAGTEGRLWTWAVARIEGQHLLSPESNREISVQGFGEAIASLLAEEGGEGDPTLQELARRLVARWGNVRNPELEPETTTVFRLDRLAASPTAADDRVNRSWEVPPLYHVLSRLPGRIAPIDRVEFQEGKRQEMVVSVEGVPRLRRSRRSWYDSTQLREARLDTIVRHDLDSLRKRLGKEFAFAQDTAFDDELFKPHPRSRWIWKLQDGKRLELWRWHRSLSDSLIFLSRQKIRAVLETWTNPTDTSGRGAILDSLTRLEIPHGGFHLAKTEIVMFDPVDPSRFGRALARCLDSVDCPGLKKLWIASDSGKITVLPREVPLDWFPHLDSLRTARDSLVWRFDSLGMHFEVRWDSGSLGDDMGWIRESQRNRMAGDPGAFLEAVNGPAPEGVVSREGRGGMEGIVDSLEARERKARELQLEIIPFRIRELNEVLYVLPRDSIPAKLPRLRRSSGAP